MATYKPIRKTASGTEEIKIPYAVLADPPDLSKYITTDGGTINKSKTIKMDASANSNGANLKWGTVNRKNPYIGYASDQTDGTFVVGSLLGTNYASGLAIGGGSGNLLWKGTKVATTSDIPTNYVKYTAQTLTDAQKLQARTNIGVPTKTSELTNDSEFITSNGSVKRVVDYNDTSKNITIGYSGAGIAGGDIKYIAGYTTGDGTTGNVARIKDISKDALKSWLGYATVATSGSYNDLSNKPTILSEADVKGIKVDNAANADTAGKVANPFTILSSPSGGSIYETFLAYDGSAHKSFMFGTDFWVDQTGTPTVFLNNSGVTAGTYNSVTVDKKGRVTAGTNTPVVDTSNLAKLDAENTFTKGQVITGNTSGGYSIDASGYVKGSWLQSSVKSNKGSGTGMVCVFDSSGWIYYRTPSEILSEANGVPKSAFSLDGTTLTITI